MKGLTPCVSSGSKDGVSVSKVTCQKSERRVSGVNFAIFLGVMLPAKSSVSGVGHAVVHPIELHALLSERAK